MPRETFWRWDYSSEYQSPNSLQIILTIDQTAQWLYMSTEPPSFRLHRVQIGLQTIHILSWHRLRGEPWFGLSLTRNRRALGTASKKWSAYCTSRIGKGTHIQSLQQCLYSYRHFLHSLPVSQRTNFWQKNLCTSKDFGRGDLGASQEMSEAQGTWRCWNRETETAGRPSHEPPLPTHGVWAVHRRTIVRVSQDPLDIGTDRRTPTLVNLFR